MNTDVLQSVLKFYKHVNPIWYDFLIILKATVRLPFN